ncbi:helix-turn-helix domain-containing protein [Streptococcus parauberis]|uniref:helix-turn-helix domain-containing protein n=1 Tax=Streptococcus parauberis TaxID=1348 RepID=UPI0037B75BA7
MTIRKEFNKNLTEIGAVIRQKRLDLSLEKKSREYFLEDRISKGIIEESTISIETLKNIENGKTMPSIHTLKILSVAFEMDFSELINTIYDFI